MDRYIPIICVIIYLIAGYKVLWSAARNVRYGDFFDENFLMSIASIGAICIGEYEEAIMVMLLYRIGEYLQGKAVDKSRRSIAALVDIMPDHANIEKDGELEQVDPSSVGVGEIIFIKPGERVPLDGVVTEGFSRLDTAAISGESMPRDILPGSQVYSGSVNLDGLLKVRVTAKAEDSTASRILELVENAAASRAKTESFITRFSRYYTPAVCALAAAAAIIPPIFVGNFTSWLHRGLIFLVVSCPCALIISIPLGFFGGIGGASSRGILIKGGNYLEALSKAGTVVFDKTGTLTKGVFKIVAIHPQGLEQDRLLELAAYAESFSDHPISRSLADEYGKKIDKSRVRDVSETAGKGISSVVDGHTVVCGNHHYMEDLGVAYKECSVLGTTVHVVLDGVYAGHITISDVIKESSADALSELKAEGIGKLAMLTGDKPVIAEYIAGRLPALDDYYGGLLPQEKTDIAKKLMDELPEGKTLAFVGDGINDAPVLTAADVGIAMGGMGSAAAIEAADIVLMNDDPSDVALALRISRKTMRIVRENIVFSIGIKVLVLILTAFGYESMWLAAFADVGVCLIAIMNSMRTLRIK